MLIILIIVALIIFFYFRGKKSMDSDVSGGSGADSSSAASGAAKTKEKPLTDKQLEKKIKGIHKALSYHYGYYPGFVEALQDLAKLTARGHGVTQDTDLACRLWEEAVDVALLLKIGSWDSGDEKFHSFDPDEMVDFFLNGEYVPRDLERAMGVVNKLIDAGEPKAVYLRQDVIRQQLPEDAPDRNAFLRSDYAANLKEYTEALKLLQASRLLDLYAFQLARQAELEKLEPVFFAAGFDEQSAKGLPWLLNEIGWTAPGPAPDIYRSKELATVIDEEEKTGIMYHLVPRYEELAKAGDAEAMRRLGYILRDVRSSRPGSDEDISGIMWLQKAADAGNVLAQYMLDPKKTDPSAMAALAQTGDIEALYALGHMVEKGLGGPASPAAAFMIWNMAWNIIGDCRERKDYHGMFWKYKLARAEGDIREETLLFWCAGEVEESGEFSIAGNYGPASYELQHSHFAETTEDGYHWMGDRAERSGYAKAKLLCGLQHERDARWDGYVNRFYTYADRKTQAQEAAAYAKIEKERQVGSIALSMPGLPDLELIRKGIIPEDLQALTARSEEITPDQTADPQKDDCRVVDMPHFIFDEMNRRWTYTGFLGDAAKYCLEVPSQAIAGIDSLDAMDGHTEVWISQRHIHGNIAKTFTHSFHW